MLITTQTLEHTDGDFAFIHDASEVRYQYYIDCNFTEVGEPFAEQPLAVAVQQVNKMHYVTQVSLLKYINHLTLWYMTKVIKLSNSILLSLCNREVISKKR